MTAFSPVPQSTTGPFTAPVALVLESLARHRHSTAKPEVHPGLQWAVAVAAVALAGFAWLIAGGWPLLAVVVAVIAFALAASVFLPDVIGDRWDRQRAAEGGE